MLTIEMMWYLIGESIINRTTSLSAALLYDRIMYVSVILIPGTLIQIIKSYHQPLHGKKLLINYLPGLFFIILLPTPFFISGMQKGPLGWTKIVGPAFLFFKIYLVFYAAQFFYELIITYRKSEPHIKNEIRYIAAAIIPFIFKGFFILIICPIFGIQKLNILFYSCSLAYLAGVLIYAITTRRLFGLNYNQKISILRKEITKLSNSTQIKSYDELTRSLSVLFGCNVMIKSNSGTIVSCSWLDKSYYLQANSRSFSYTDGSPKIMLRHEEKGELNRLMKKNCIDAVVPLKINGEFSASLLLGKGFIRHIYSVQDICLFKKLICQIETIFAYLQLVELQVKEMKKVIDVIKKKPIMLFESGGTIFRVTSPHKLVKVVHIDCDQKIIRQYPILRKYR
ncbi:MAG: hypothetical protein GY874_18085 [Desulfobacteraceae bacterium]|nr:hypothetical protein [Desulfobacteraceae bacterium]